MPISEIKKFIKETLPDGFKNIVRDTLPFSTDQLPAIVISSLEYQEAPVGIGDIIGTVRENMIDTGTIKGTRIIGHFLFDLWVQKTDDGLEKIENIAKDIMTAIDTKKIDLRKNGFLKIAISQIKLSEIIKKEVLWGGAQDVWRKWIDYQVIYEKAFIEKSGDIIEQVAIDIDSEYKESLVIGKPLSGLVPDLLNMSKDKAKTILTQAGFVSVETIYQESPYLTDIVISQNPSFGSKVLLKSPINLVVSKQHILLTQNARAGGREADKPWLMIDGDFDRGKYASHYWNKPNTYLQISLFKMSFISKIRTLLGNKDDQSYRYKIEVSEDGQKWVMIVDKTTGEYRSWQIDEFTPIKAMYVRTTGTYNSANNGFRVIEQEIYGFPEPYPEIISLTQNAQAGGQKAINPKRMIDGKYTNEYTYASHRWDKPGSCLQLTLSELKKVNRVRTLLWDKDDRFYRYKIEVSENGQEWVTVVDKTVGEYFSWQTDDFDPVIARYIKTTGNFNTANNLFHVVEQEVYGQG